MKVIDKRNKKDMFFFLFLLAHTTIVCAGPVEAKEVFVDTLDNETYMNGFRQRE